MPTELAADFFGGRHRLVLALMLMMGIADWFLGWLHEFLHHFPRVNKIDWR
jgi:hypothetical protein